MIVNPELLPLGVTEPEGRVGAIEQHQADIDLLDLVTGKMLRRLPGVGRPLMIDAGHLIGLQFQAGSPGLRLFRTTVSSETAVEWSVTFDLPEWVDPLGSDAGFVVRFAREDGSYVLFWKAYGRYRDSGAGPPAQLDAAHDVAERIEIDAGTLALVGRRDEDGFDDAARLRRGEDLTRQQGGSVYRQAGQLRNAPWATPGGERFLRTFGRPGEKDQRLGIARADTPEADPIVTIQASELDIVAPELSLDAKHLAVVERDGTALVRRVYSTVSGEQVAAMAYREGFQSFRIFDRRLIFLEERTSNTNDLEIGISRILHGLDTKSGEMLWEYRFEPIVTDNRSFLPQ